MSNKTSDNNVANIERLNNFANMTFLYGNRVNLNVSGLKGIQNDIKNILSDYTRQKQINEEHKRLNGELREKVKELEEKNKHLSNTSDYETISLECTNLEEQLEIANNRIKELEEENRIYVLEGSPVRLEIYIKENYIPKQVVIDKIEELKNQISIDICIENNLEKHYELKYKIDVLQELLEGGLHENRT